MNDEYVYILESEIDKAIPYLDKLNNEILLLLKKKKELSKAYYPEINRLKRYKNKIVENPKEKYKKLKLFSWLIKKNEKDNTSKSINFFPERKYLKSWNCIKDGYNFNLRLAYVYTKDKTKPDYYEFFVNIIYGLEKRYFEFYKKFNIKEESYSHFNLLKGVFEHLNRRDIMQKLFLEKQEIINSLKK